MTKRERQTFTDEFKKLTYEALRTFSIQSSLSMNG